MPVQCRLQKDDQGLPCETSAGESASDVMDQAVNECSSAPPPPPPPPSSSGPKTCPAGQHIATSGTSGGGSNSICIKCATNQFKRDESADSCDVCPQGWGMPGGANGNHDDCIECTGAQASPDGVECKTCPPGQLPRDDHTTCEVAAVYGGDETKEEDSGVTAVVTAFATSGKGYQRYATYRVALRVTAKDAKNVFSIYGANTDGSQYHMQIPGAKQIESDSIMSVGGVDPSRFDTYPNAKFGELLTGSCKYIHSTG